jgi:hypothetical protein
MNCAAAGVEVGPITAINAAALAPKRRTVECPPLRRAKEEIAEVSASSGRRCRQIGQVQARVGATALPGAGCNAGNMTDVHSVTRSLIERTRMPGRGTGHAHLKITT